MVIVKIETDEFSYTSCFSLGFCQDTAVNQTFAMTLPFPFLDSPGSHFAGYSRELLVLDGGILVLMS